MGWCHDGLVSRQEWFIFCNVGRCWQLWNFSPRNCLPALNRYVIAKSKRRSCCDTGVPVGRWGYGQSYTRIRLGLVAIRSRRPMAAEPSHLYPDHADIPAAYMDRLGSTAYQAI